ncbi:hypothetical protein B0H11DRAFT_2361712 [Mycena galericulata]|nr:hypothetical protein B0H11DRAFT_2361712 [Mycena galericulata]
MYRLLDKTFYQKHAPWATGLCYSNWRDIALPTQGLQCFLDKIKALDGRSAFSVDMDILEWLNTPTFAPKALKPKVEQELGQHVILLQALVLLSQIHGGAPCAPLRAILGIDGFRLESHTILDVCMRALADWKNIIPLAFTRHEEDKATATRRGNVLCNLRCAAFMLSWFMKGNISFPDDKHMSMEMIQLCDKMVRSAGIDSAAINLYNSLKLALSISPLLLFYDRDFSAVSIGTRMLLSHWHAQGLRAGGIVRPPILRATEAIVWTALHGIAERSLAALATGENFDLAVTLDSVFLAQRQLEEPDAAEAAWFQYLDPAPRPANAGPTIAPLQLQYIPPPPPAVDPNPNRPDLQLGDGMPFANPNPAATAGGFRIVSGQTSEQQNDFNGRKETPQPQASTSALVEPSSPTIEHPVVPPRAVAGHRFRPYQPVHAFGDSQAERRSGGTQKKA